MRKFAIAIALAGICSGCGGEEPAAPAADPSEAHDFAPASGDRPPVVESVRLEPTEPAVGDTVRAVTMARDPDGRRVTVSHRWWVHGAEVASNEAGLVLEDVAKGAEIRVSVVASDGTRESPPVEATAWVIDRPPALTSATLSPKDSVAPGQPVTVTVAGSDPDGDPVDYEYTWYVNGERREETSGLFQTEGLQHGDVVYAEVRATDGANWTDRERTAPVTVGSGHPEITSMPPGFREDGVFRYEVTAVDPDGDKRLRYALEEGPEGMAIDSVLGDLVWRPRPDQHGVHAVSLVVRDSTGLETKQSFSVTVRDRDPKVDDAAPADAEDSEAPADAAPEDDEVDEESE